MEARGRIAGALVLLATAVSCAPPAEDGEDGETAEPEVPLDLTVDHVDVAHGSMRLRATMADGSPEVSIVLGDACDGREVGRGMATRVSLVWAFDEKDVADALRCDLVVRAHAWTDEGRVVETAKLELVLDVTAVSAAAPDEGASGEGPSGEGASGETAARPELTTVARDPKSLGLTFRSLTPRAALTVGDSRIERAAPDAKQDDGERDQVEDDTTATFAVPYEAFARALLDDRPLRIDGTEFEPAVAFGATGLERNSPDDETDTEKPNATEEIETEEVQVPEGPNAIAEPEEGAAIDEEAP